MILPRAWPAVLILTAMSCSTTTTVQRGPIAEWRLPPGAGIFNPTCASPPPGAEAVLRARLTPLESIIESGEPASRRIEAVRALEPAFEEFRIAEAAACRLMLSERITAADYDVFLDSVAVFLPPVDPSALPGTPQPLSPADGAVFDDIPRTTTLEWAPVPGASSYIVEVQSQPSVVGIDGAGEATVPGSGWVPGRGGLHAYEVTGTGLRFEFIAAQPGRWRVRALDALGRAGHASPWRTFSYTR